MNEIQFVNKNSARWKDTEQALIRKEQTSPDKLARLYMNLLDDLAYAQTYFTNNNSTEYLNNLTEKAHQQIYRNKKNSKKRIIQFWSTELPLLIKDSRKYFYISFAVFVISLLIGAFSAANDQDFVRLILGNDYVDNTIQNIESGDPLAIYKSANNIDMFLGITFNNIMVSFYAFIFGLLFTSGTFIILIKNGIMLGSFQYFFYDQGLLLDSILIIWIHGTLEIFAIIMAGSAGIMMGNHLIFTGTLPRSVSFRIGLQKALKIIFGIVPCFIIAGALEGFVTRYTFMPDILKASIIIASLILIIWYFFLLPGQRYNEINKTTLTNH